MTAHSVDIARVSALRQLATERRSVRAISRRTVNDNIVNQIVKVASTAPSWCNVQAWRAYLVQLPEIHALSDDLLRAAENRESCPDLPFIQKFDHPYLQRKQSTDAILREARTGSSRVDARAEFSFIRRNWEFFGAPQAIFLTVPKRHLPYALVDLGCFLQMLLLTITAEGLVACAQGSLAHFPHVLRRHLPIANEEAVVCGVSFGYEDKDHSIAVRTPRVSLDEILWRRSKRLMMEQLSTEEPHGNQSADVARPENV